ncbi:MAG: 50S ribosomal protein L7/L12 [bacterium]
MTEEKNIKSPKEEPKVETDAAVEAADVEVPEKFKSLVQSVEQMSVLDLAELVKIFEKKFNVSAAAPAMMIAGNGAKDVGEEVEEKTDFNIEITDTGSNKIAVIKAIRATSDMGLKEAKDLADAAPKLFKESVPKEEAEKIKALLEEAGAKVTLK